MERAAINAAGTLGPFVELPVSLSLERGWGTAAVIGNYVYVFGGNGVFGSTSSLFNSIERAAINPDGSLSPFVVLNDALPEAGQQMSAVETDKYLYLVGVEDQGDANDGQVWQAPIHPDGSIGQFFEASHLLDGLTSSAVALLGNTMYAFGGWYTPAGGSPDSAYAAMIQAATLEPDGTLGSWQILPQQLPFAMARNTQQPDVYKDWFYIFVGGQTAAGNPWIAQGTIR